MSVIPATISATRVVPSVRRRAGLWRAGPWRVAPVAAVLAGLALLAGGCGGGGSSGTAVASVSPTGSPSASGSPGQGAQRGDAVRYAQCMRSHGVPKFPDPNPDGRFSIDANKLGVDPLGPVLKAAEQACKSLLPGGGAPDQGLSAKEREQALAYSRCMRSKGVKNFPDPNAEGGIGLPDGLDPDSPQFKAADAACQRLMPGGGQGRQQHSSGPGQGGGA